MWLPLLFLLSTIISAVLLFIMVYYIIMFSDLEMDYINPIDLCHRLNQLVLPEMGLHLFLTVTFLFTLRILPFLLNLPLVLYHAHIYNEKRYRLEPTDVFRQLLYRKRESFIKLGFFLLSFFFYLFKMVATLVE